METDILSSFPCDSMLGAKMRLFTGVLCLKTTALGETRLPEEVGAARQDVLCAERGQPHRAGPPGELRQRGGVRRVAEDHLSHPAVWIQ